MGGGLIIGSWRVEGEKRDSLHEINCIKPHLKNKIILLDAYFKGLIGTNTQWSQQQW